MRRVHFLILYILFWRSILHACWDLWVERSRWRHPRQACSWVNDGVPVDTDLHVDLIVLLADLGLYLFRGDEMLFDEVETM